MLAVSSVGGGVLGDCVGDGGVKDVSWRFANDEALGPITRLPRSHCWS
jgi:hypothetical protein